MKARKYNGLTPHLKASKVSEFEITFSEIEQIIGSSLPKTANDRQFWANTTKHRSTLRRAVAAAGFESFLVFGSKRVRFKRAL
ncbi:hypothetical protein TomTYG75_09340 [Sphingobium sp. TomTYG75]